MIIYIFNYYFQFHIIHFDGKRTFFIVINILLQETLEWIMWMSINQDKKYSEQ